MFSAVALILMLMFNLMGNLTLEDNWNSENQSLSHGQEMVLMLDRSWTHSDWVLISENDISPLRQVDFSQLNVWMPIDSVVPEWVAVSDSAPAKWKPGVYSQQPIGGQKLLVVLEPRLPHSAGEGVISQLVQLGLAPTPLPSNGDIGGGGALPLTIEIMWPDWSIGGLMDNILQISGIFWVEPVLVAEARNLASAGLVQSGEIGQEPLWSLGINGNGVIVGIADTGVDRDHACFRNASVANGIGANGNDTTGIPNIGHRKIVLLNDTIDYWDNSTHTDARHGTHTAGTLSCQLIDSYLAELDGVGGDANFSSMTAPAYNSKLVVQDIVDGTGWVEPPMDTLLWEAARNGAIIHSDSWGDATTEYTLRSHNLDAWMRENPWSLVFVAPGNNGGIVMEPANARSVISVGGSAKDNSTDMYSQSSHGPLADGRRGIVVLAPAVGIISASSDGVANTDNGGGRASTGTSMATPIAASTTALIQQMVEQGWISMSGDERSVTKISGVQPAWVATNISGNISLGEGFSPSNNLLRALLTLSAESFIGGSHKGLNLSRAPDEMQGWGRPNLSTLVDYQDIIVGAEERNVIPAMDVWIWDSFHGEDDWRSFLEQRMDNPKIGNPLNKMSYSTWNGDGLKGPFLASGEEKSWKLERVVGDDLQVQLSWSPKPSPSPVDDLQLIITLPDGSFYVGDRFDADGNSSKFIDSSFLDVMSSTNESTVGVRIAASILGQAPWVELSVRAKNVTIGNHSGSVGIDGDRVGFAIAAKGLMHDSLDSDEDGVADFIDLCSNTTMGWFVDKDGCSEWQVDSDGDGINDAEDGCPGYDDGVDIDLDGMPDDCDGNIDSDGDGVGNGLDLCPETLEGEVVDGDGCWPYNPTEILIISPSAGNYSGVVPIDFILNDIDKNQTRVEIFFRSVESGDEILVWQGTDDGGGGLVSVNVDIWGFWAFFDSERNNSSIPVDVIWTIYDLDNNGSLRGISTIVNTEITLTSDAIGPQNNNDGIGLGGGHKTVWPLLAFSIIVLAYLFARISLRSNKSKGLSGTDVLGPYFEDE